MEGDSEDGERQERTEGDGRDRGGWRGQRGMEGDSEDGGRQERTEGDRRG